MAEYPIQQPNTDNPNSLLPLDISRQDPDQPRASSINLEAHDTTPSRRLHSSTYRGYPENTGTFRLYHPRPDQTSADQPPRKKMHRHDSEDRTEGSVDRSTPSASSQSGIEDQETEADQSQRSEASPAPTTFAFAVPKKKRTRTLTTPHQAAVLHALLAQACQSIVFLNCGSQFFQSRFPTTAMREEVGKQIGLSARKVQVSIFMILSLYGLNKFLTYIRLTLNRFGFKTSVRRPSDHPLKAQRLRINLPICHMLHLLPVRQHRARPSNFTARQVTLVPLVTQLARDTQSIRGPVVSVVGAWMGDFFLLRMPPSL